MSRRITGTMLLFIAALLNATRYLTAAIFGSGMMSWSSENFQALLQYIGSDLGIWSAIALLFGVIYLLWAELEQVGVIKK